MTATVSIDDIADPGVSFGQSTYEAGEGGSATVTVILSANPGVDVVVPVVGMGQDGATDQDYSGVPGSVTFTVGGALTQSLTVMAADDTENDDGESLLLEFGMLPPEIRAISPSEATVSILDNDGPEVTVSFGQATYEAVEGGSTTVTVELSADPEREVEILITATGQGGATDQDYTGVPASVTFPAGGALTLSVTVMATNDTENDDGESVDLSFGGLPAGVSDGLQVTAVVSITDNDDPPVTVSFGQAMYEVDEGGSTTVTVELSRDPEREIEILVMGMGQAGAMAQDYSGVPESVTFTAGGALTLSVTVMARDDTEDDDGESVLLSFGTLPGGVNAAPPSTATVTIVDDDYPSVEVSFDMASYTVTEGGLPVPVTVDVSVDPEREVEIRIVRVNQFGATAQDYSGVPGSVTFTAGGALTQSFTVTATDDAVDDDGERVELSFGTPLPMGMSAGGLPSAVVTLTDDDERGLVLSEASPLSLAEADVPVTETYTVELASQPTTAVTVSLTVEGANALTTEPTVLPTSLEFTVVDWNIPRTVTVTVLADGDAVDERATVMHAVSGGDYGSSEDKTLAVDVVDDDTTSSVITLTTAPTGVPEEAGETEVVVTATLDEGTFKTVRNIVMLVSAGADTERSDFSRVMDFPLTIPAQMLSGTATFMLTPIDDDLWEPEESVTVSGAISHLVVRDAVVALEDDEAEPVLSFKGPSEMREAGGSADLVVKITNGVGFETAQSVTLDFSAGTPLSRATRGVDFTVSPPGNTLTLGRGGDIGERDR